MVTEATMWFVTQFVNKHENEDGHRNPVENITECGEAISKPTFTIFPRYHQLRASKGHIIIGKGKHAFCTFDASNK